MRHLSRLTQQVSVDVIEQLFSVAFLVMDMKEQARLKLYLSSLEKKV